MVLNQPKPSVERICSKTTTGLAWIEPTGEVHWLNWKNTHGQWAYFYFRPERDDGTWSPVNSQDSYDELINMGWMRVSNVLHLTVGELDAVRPAAWDAWASIAAECGSSLQVSAEESIVGISSGRFGATFVGMKLADAVERFCSRKGKDAFWSSMMGESLIRKLVRSMLLEDLAGFKERTKGIAYASPTDDPTFDNPMQRHLPYKSQARDVKRAWAAEADHEFMKSIIKVHWLSGLEWDKKLNRLLALGGNNEISTMGYLPDSDNVTSMWGKLGVIVRGRVTLAANDMNAVMSGYGKDIPAEITAKYKSSGVPRRATEFSANASAWSGPKSDLYILDRGSFKPERSRHNEFIVDNWRPIGLVIGVPGDLFVDMVRDSGLMNINHDIATEVLKHDLPIFDGHMKPIDRKKLEEAVRGEGESEDFKFP